MTYMQAALTILAHAEYPLTIGELTSVAIADGLIRPRGRTPDRTMASVLYRRMAGDADAPIISRGGRFWLRGRALPEQERGYLSRRARRARSTGRRLGTHGSRPTTRRATILPPPPLRVAAALTEDTVIVRPEATSALARRERAVARSGTRAASLLQRLDIRRGGGKEWDAAQTDAQLIAPLLVHLGYRRGRDVARVERPGRGTTASILAAEGQPVMALLVRRLEHNLHDDDVWRALSLARDAAAPYAAVTNGRELRLYAVVLAEVHDDPAAALVLTLDLGIAVDEQAKAAQATELWLLSRSAVAAGALDAYAADRVVAAALFEALDAPDAPLARALVADVRGRTGLALPAETVLRHARLVLRGRRDRDGEAALEDVATITGVRGPRLAPPALPIVTVARSA